MRTLLLILLISSCGQSIYISDNIKEPTNKEPRKISTTDPIFKPYVVEFESFYGKKITNIPINFSKLEGRKVGVCYSWSSGHREIEIDKDRWENELTENQKSALIFHELGHCELDREHMDTLKEDKCPKSIMNWILIKNSCMKKYKKEYFKEIFQ